MVKRVLYSASRPEGGGDTSKLTELCGQMVGINILDSVCCVFNKVDLPIHKKKALHRYY